MSKRQQLFGHVPLTDHEVERASSTGDITYPLGIPRRVIDAMKRELEAFTEAMLGRALPPLEVTNLMPSDVPGVLIAGGMNEILASLGRIQRAKGFEASERAYLKILERALADGRDDIAQQLTHAHREITGIRKGALNDNYRRADVTKPSATPVHDLMQQKADEAQARAKVAKLTEHERNAQKAQEFNARREQEAERAYLQKANENDLQRSMEKRREQERISDHLRQLAGTPPPGSSMLGMSLQQGGVLNAGQLTTMGHAPISGNLIATMQAQGAQYGE